MTRLAQRLGYSVRGYDINDFSLFIARVLSFGFKNIRYDNKDFTTLSQRFDVVTATSLLSVVEDKSKSLEALLDLLKDENSTLIIIEPTEEMCLKNVKKSINDLTSWWHYKGLLLWAKARENKAVPKSLFDNLKNVNIEYAYHLDGMIRVTYIHRIIS
jgi:ubiquinone/menaquinone biosynthesis C-methylase UbiE